MRDKFNLKHAGIFLFVFVISFLSYRKSVYMFDINKPVAEALCMKERIVEKQDLQHKKQPVAEIPCLRYIFNDTVLVINFNYPFYGHSQLLHELYDDAFGVVVTCGPTSTDALYQGPDILYSDEESWYFRYQCLSKAIKKFPNFSGYIYSNDDVVINWWNLVKLNRSKIWQGGHIDWRQNAYGSIINERWVWWQTDMGLKACQRYYEQLRYNTKIKPFNTKKELGIYLINSKGKAKCAKGWTDLFYIPGRVAQNYVKLSNIAYKHQLFLEIAGNNILRSLDRIENFENLDGTYLPDIGIKDISALKFWRTYDLRLPFVHPIKFNSNEKMFTRSLFYKWIVHYKNTLVRC